MTQDKEQDSEKKVHRPEFVILEPEIEERGRTTQGEGSFDYESFLKNIGKKRFGFRIRLLALIFFTTLSFGLIMTTAYALFSSFFALLFLLQSHDLNKNSYAAFQKVAKVLVCTLGALIAIFSPALGLGFIVLYFMMLGEQVNKSFMARFFTDETFTQN